MKNILDEATFNEVKQRLKNLTPNHQARWGTLTANAMLTHLNDQLRVAMNEQPTKPSGNFFMYNIVRLLLLRGLIVIPKGKIKTFKEVDQALGNGTSPTDLQIDREKLFENMERFRRFCLEADKPSQPHAFFGEFTHRQWGRMTFLHFEHHLKQFGI